MKRPTLVTVALAAAAAAAPATASAASIGLTVPGGDPTIAYTASPGEVNAIEMHGTVQGGLDLRMPFFEYGAPLTVGASCGGTAPIVCGAPDRAFPVDVSLGDKDDVANTNSFTGRLTMDAGADDDDVLAGGIDVTANGGSGNDTMLLAANALATGDGGSGRDKIHAGLGAAAAILTGGTGRDLLVPGGFMFNDAKGGSGNDTLVSFTGDQVTLSGGSGSDLLVAPTGRNGIMLDGGADNDIAQSHVGSVVVDAGTGSDFVEVRGGSGTSPDTVTCGSGHDVVWADADDDVAADCELVLRRGTPPTFEKVRDAEDAARALIAHRANPAAQK
jgi:Ca2+-binding RTX toxin-like protein